MMKEGQLGRFLIIVARTMMAFLGLVLMVEEVAAKAKALFPLAMPGCQKKCGGLTIPYPFGIGDGCYYNDSLGTYNYRIICNDTYNPPIPRPIYGVNIEVLNIDLEGHTLRIHNSVSYVCYNKMGNWTHYKYPSTHLARFTISTTQNMFVAIGCDTYVWFEGTRFNRSYKTGCMTVCTSPDDVTDGECTGVGCCQVSMPDRVGDITTEAKSLTGQKNVSYFNPCSAASIVAKDAFKFSRRNLSFEYDDYQNMQLPMVFNWTVGTQNCSTSHANGDCICKENALCLDAMDEMGYRCQCLSGFYGNPYLSDCQDVDECADPKLNKCEEHANCVNTIGSYECKCRDGYHGNGTITDRCISNQRNMVLRITLGAGGGIILLLLLGFLLHWQHGKKQLIKMRETFFRQNGGLILHQRLSARDVVKIFTVEDLEKATNNYSDNNIIGRGGFGMVYKGTLPNNQVVAIKKSLKVDSMQIEQFINEVLVLSQVNNRNVVKLLGCCLETEVPLLVYEFIGNGTLYEHLHDQQKASLLSWDIRLRIATEVAEVLAYLHTTVSTPIIHRDIKSMNILLDEKCIAKVSDFGASRLVPMDQDQLATMVLGTRGYLDPEYMQTSELTEKSDVYSFGVVLVELLTRRKALCYERPENERCLAMHFLLKLKNQCLLEILDGKIINRGVTEQVMEAATLAQSCLKLKGEDRPSMREVAMELERIKKRDSHPWSPIVGLAEEETQYLLIETTLEEDDGGAYCSKKNIDSYNSQSTVLEVDPLDDGR